MDLVTEQQRRHGDGPALLSLLTSWGRRHGNSGDSTIRNVLTLNVLLLGDRQSGRSSVGNALIGGEEFQTGTTCLPGVAVTTEPRALSRNFPGFFRRQGAESDLLLRVVDTPPAMPRPLRVHELCSGGVHVLLLVIRADTHLQQDDTHLRRQAECLFGPDWSRHSLLVITHADRLEEAGLQPSVFLKQSSDWLRALAEEVGGGVFFLDNSRDWPTVRGRPLRERLLRLSAKNHHQTLKLLEDPDLQCVTSPSI